MSGRFAYRPKFVDIRVRPPAEEEVRAAAAEREAKQCDQKGCRKSGACRAPKSRDNLNEYYWFCAQHAAEYNRSWNYFQGMSDDQFQSFSADAETGHRPTWRMKADAQSREAAQARKAASFDPAKLKDPYGLFRGGPAPRRGAAHRYEPERRLNRVQITALEELALEEDADSRTIRLRYAELVKRFHPDANGGDRSAEAKLHRVIKAYQVLKTAGLA